MNFKWKKIGTLFEPDGTKPWMASHAQVPFTLELNDRIRVFFSTREKKSNNNFKSYIGFVDLDKTNLNKKISVSENPVLELGGLGAFDEFGTMAGSVVKTHDQFYLYYCGWQRSVSTPYNWAIGLAVSRDGKNFKKYSNGPILSASINEPFLQACPIVYQFENKWHMYYLSGLKWLSTESGKHESEYVLMHATSDDGIKWQRNAKPIIESVVEHECQTSASIIKLNNIYHMFFSYRHGLDFRNTVGRGYKIGYAYSTDLINWVRNDSQCLVSELGSDKMTCYPHIFDFNKQYYMLYCGSDFGRNGFSYAVLE